MAVFLGLLAGLSLSLLVISLWPVSTEALDKARELGIVSITILSGYPKAMEVQYYLIFLFFTPATAAIFWALYRYMLSRREWEQFESLASVQTPIRYRWFIVAALAALFLSFHGAYFTSYWISEWYLFGEQGENVSWAKAILSGKVLYRDTFCLYGPLMQYGLAFFMDIFGVNLWSARLYAFFTYALTALVIGTVPFAVLRRPLHAALLALTLLAFYFPVKLSVNATPLRLFIPFVSFYLLYRYASSPRRYLVLLAGAVTGLAFLYSQENGLAALLAAVSLLIVSVPVRGMSKIRSALIEAALFILGFFAVITPFIIFFALNDALWPFLQTILEYPRYVMLGYAAVPAPDIFSAVKGFVADDLPFGRLRYPVVFAMPPVIYAVGLLVIALNVFKGRYSRRELFFFAVLTYGVITFRSALGRSDGFHLVQVYAPAFFVLAYLADVTFGGSSVKDRVKALIIFCVIFAMPAFFVLTNFNKKAPREFVRVNITEISDKFSAVPRPGFVQVDTPETGGVYMPRRTSAQVEELLGFKSNLTLADTVYVFGNVPFYYFLLDKRNPTRFDYPYWAVTTGMQAEIVRDLVRNKPDYILYKLDRMDRIDDMPPSIQVPLVYRHIMENYALDTRFHYMGFRVFTPKRKPKPKPEEMPPPMPEPATEPAFKAVEESELLPVVVVPVPETTFIPVIKPEPLPEVDAEGAGAGVEQPGGEE